MNLKIVEERGESLSTKGLCRFVSEKCESENCEKYIYTTCSMQNDNVNRE